MKLSCIPVFFFDPAIPRDKTMSSEDWLSVAVDVGLDGTEVFEGSFAGRWKDPSDVGEVVKFTDAVKDAGLAISMYSIENNFANPAEREQVTERVKRAVDAAVLLKTNILRVTAGQHHSEEELAYIRNADRDDVVRSCVEGLKGCLDYAEEKQVMLALEDHLSVGWDLEEFTRILDLLDDERMKVNLDTSNVHPDTVVELARRVADRVVHLHVKDRLNNDHGIVIGTGEVDFKGIFRHLKNAGFDGWMSLEALRGGKNELQTGVNNIRNAWDSA
jgi:sugar phosphate isomerase/epimerase